MGRLSRPSHAPRWGFKKEKEEGEDGVSLTPGLRRGATEQRHPLQGLRGEELHLRSKAPTIRGTPPGCPIEAAALPRPTFPLTPSLSHLGERECRFSPICGYWRNLRIAVASPFPLPARHKRAIIMGGRAEIGRYRGRPAFVPGAADKSAGWEGPNGATDCEHLGYTRHRRRWPGAERGPSVRPGLWDAPWRRLAWVMLGGRRPRFAAVGADAGRCLAGGPRGDGLRVVDCGILSTPGMASWCGIWRRRAEPSSPPATTRCPITESNCFRLPEWPLAARQGARCLDLYRSRPVASRDRCWPRRTERNIVRDAAAVHVEQVLATVDAAAIREAALRVVVDAVNGAGGAEMRHAP